MTDTEKQCEAKANRSQIMDRLALLTQHGRQKMLVLTMALSRAGTAFVAMMGFIPESQNSPQLTPILRWRQILGVLGA